MMIHYTLSRRAAAISTIVMSMVALVVILIALAACSHSKPVSPPVPVPSVKNTLTWDRNSESDMQEYRVYVCWTPGCDPTKVHTMLKVVPQTPPGVTPAYWRELAGSVGAYAVTARDTAGNESAFSTPVPFDRR